MRTATALAPNGDPILSARFAVPAIPATFVRRPRLVEQLSQGLDRPLLLVNGPAGAGKTLLVADWVSTAPMPGPVVWLTSERGDDTPGVFWAYFLAALRHHGVALPDDIGTPTRARDVDPSLLARLAASLSTRKRPVLVVLDEFDRLTSAELAADLHTVLRHSAPGLRLVLVSRIDPLLPLHRYRTAGEMTDIRSDDLAFTPAETASLLGRHGLLISAEGVEALTERTQGWAAGIRLSALAALRADDPEAFLRGFEASHSTVADFLTAEVLDTQPVQTRDLLLRTSILDQVHPDLANELTGRDDADAVLSALQLANAFVEPVGHDWYRVHPLFAEILQVHLRIRHPGLDIGLHRRAARWLHGAGLLESALSHAAAAGDWDFAASVLVTDLAIGRLLTGLDAHRLVNLFADMPPDITGPAPELVRAAVHLAGHDAEGALVSLARAEEHPPDGDGDSDGDDGSDSPGVPVVALSCALVRALAGALTGSSELAWSAAQAADSLTRRIPSHLVDQHPEVRALIQTALGSTLLAEGRLDAARAALTAAAEPAAEPALAPPRHESLSRLALIDALQGWPGKAEAQARAALADAGRHGLPSSSLTGAAQLVLAAVAFERDDAPGVRAALGQVTKSCGESPDPVVLLGLSVLRSRILLAKNDRHGARTALDEAVPLIPPTPWARGRLALAASAVHLAAGDPAAALRALEVKVLNGPERAVAAARCHLAARDAGAAREALDAIPADPGHGAVGPAVKVRILLARAQLAAFRRDDVAAGRLLAQAVAAARPDRLRRPFREAGPWLRQLLHRQGAPARGYDWLPPELLGGPPRPEPGAGGHAQVVEPLSGREHDVLERAAQLMSTEEIAADLHLSVNTVKSHLKSINRKLCTTRRGDAVRRARELHIL